MRTFGRNPRHADGDGDSHGERDQEDGRIVDVLALHAPRLVDPPVELGPRDQRSRERDRSDHRAHERHRQMSGVVRLAAQQLDGGDRAGRAAAHAVVQRHHLRHVGERNALAPPPGPADREQQGHQRQGEIHRQVGRRVRTDTEHVEKAGQRGEQHPVAGHADARPRRDRRGHPLQAVDEQKGRDEVGGLNDPSSAHRRVLIPWLSWGGWT